MFDWLIAALGIAAILAIAATTGPGRRLRSRLPLGRLSPGRAPKQDRDYFLRVCDGDPERVRRLLDVERERARNPEMTEAEAYRRAIRAYLRDRM